MALKLVGWNTVLDSDYADELSAFYEKLLGWTRFQGEEYTVLANLEQKGLPTWITFQQVDDYVPPVWPAALDEQQQMAHLDFHVEDVEEGVKYAPVSYTHLKAWRAQPKAMRTCFCSHWARAWAAASS